MDPFLKAFDSAYEDVTEWLGEAGEFLDSDLAKNIGEGMFVNLESQRKEYERTQRLSNIGGSPRTTVAEYKASRSEAPRPADPAMAERRWKAILNEYISAAEGTKVNPASGSSVDMNSIKRRIG